MRILRTVAVQVIAAVVLCSTVAAAELHFSKDATEIDLSSAAPISVAVEELKLGKGVPEGLDVGIKAALMRLFVEGVGVSAFGEAARKPIWSLSSGEVPFLVVSGSIEREPLAYKFEFAVSSGYTGGELLKSSAYLPVAGDLMPYLVNIASRILACANRELQPPKEQVSPIFLQLFGLALKSAEELVAAPDEESLSQARIKLKQALLAATELDEELLRTWAFKEFAAHTFERAGARDAFIKPFVEMAFGRRLSAMKAGEALLESSPEAAKNTDLLCLLARASARLGKKREEERFTRMVQKIDKSAVCVIELLAQKLLIRGDKKRAAALLMQPVEKGKLSLRLIKLLEQTGKLDRQRIARLRAQRLEELGDRAPMVSLLAARFLKSPDKNLLGSIDPALLSAQLRERLRKKLHELELTSGWSVPEIWRRKEPKFEKGTIKPKRTLSEQLELMLAFLPRFDEGERKRVLGIHLECDGCTFFSKTVLRDPKEWFEPAVLKAAEKRFQFTPLSRKHLKRLLAHPENAESLLSQFDTLSVIINATAELEPVLSGESKTLPVRLSLFAFDSATGLRLRVRSYAQASLASAVETNLKLILLLGVLGVLAVLGVFLGLYFAKAMNDPRRKAQMLAGKGEIMAAAQLLREAGLGVDAERLLAEHFEREGNLRNAMEHYLSAEEPKKVLELFSQLSFPTDVELNLAGEACLALRRFETARELFERAGNTLGIAKSFELEGDPERAARIRAAYFYDSGNLRSAVEELVSIGDYETAADICFEAQDYRSAAVLYVRANKFDKVERCFLRMGKRLDIAKLKQIDVNALFGSRREEE